MKDTSTERLLIASPWAAPRGTRDALAGGSIIPARRALGSGSAVELHRLQAAWIAEAVLWPDEHSRAADRGRSLPVEVVGVEAGGGRHLAAREMPGRDHLTQRTGLAR